MNVRREDEEDVLHESLQDPMNRENDNINLSVCFQIMSQKAIFVWWFLQSINYTCPNQKVDSTPKITLNVGHILKNSKR